MNWPMCRRVERQAIRMHEMLDRLDVDPVALVRLRNGDEHDRSCAHLAGRTRAFWLGAAGPVAGCGIWGTHFVAMLPFKSGMPVSYDPCEQRHPEGA